MSKNAPKRPPQPTGENWEERAHRASKSVIAFSNFASDVVDAAASLFKMLPFWEMLVTILIFQFKLSETISYHVLAGLVFPQAIALYVTTQYKETALTRKGDFFVQVSIVFGILNTGFAVLLLLAVESGITLGNAIFFPSLSTAVSLLAFYEVQRETVMQSHRREILRQKGQHERKRVQRDFDAENDKFRILAEMDKKKRQLENRALDEIGKDPVILTVFRRGMYLTIVKEYMERLEINQRSKLGKLMIDLAERAAEANVNLEDMLDKMIEDDGEITEDEVSTAVDSFDEEETAAPRPQPVSNGHR